MEGVEHVFSRKKVGDLIDNYSNFQIELILLFVVA